MDFKVKNNSSNCAVESTLITLKIRNRTDFTFTLQVDSSPKINVLGGSPSADIAHNSLVTTDVNGTYFGVIEAGATKTRNYIIANTGSCPLSITTASITAGDFTIPPSFSATVNPGASTVLPVTFTGPTGGAGAKTSTVNISNNANITFSFNVSADMFDENIPGPGGVTGSFKLWLKSTRGITKDGSSKVSIWADLGAGPKNATQPTPANQPIYIDNATSNINFNPVIDFENGGGTEQFMYNDETPLSGFYSADIFIVMVPDGTVDSTSPKSTILGGVVSETPGDVTGVGFGNYSTALSDEVLSYNQGIVGSGYSRGETTSGKSYSGAGIINVTNNAGATGQDILYDSDLLTTSNIGSFANINGSKYWIGKNYNETANLNGRVAEIFTFETKLDAASREK